MRSLGAVLSIFRFFYRAKVATAGDSRGFGGHSDCAYGAMSQRARRTIAQIAASCS
jgi:hypothetical protein